MQVFANKECMDDEPIIWICDKPSGFFRYLTYTAKPITYSDRKGIQHTKYYGYFKAVKENDVIKCLRLSDLNYYTLDEAKEISKCKK